MKIAISFILLALSTTTCWASEPMTSEDSVSIYWNQFQQAVIHNNTNNVIALTHFPFKTNVTTDGNSKTISKKSFKTYYPQLMMQKVKLPKSDKFASLPLRVLIANKAQLESTDHLSKTSFRVHQLEFENIAGEWRLTKAYSVE